MFATSVHVPLSTMNKIDKLKAALERVESGGSPLEKKFLSYMDAIKIYKYVREFPISGFFIDIAIPDKMIAIELDGKTYHSSEEQQKRDAIKDRVLEEQGWQVIRIPSEEAWERHKFGGSLLRVFRAVNPNDRVPYIISELLEVDPRGPMVKEQEEPMLCDNHHCFTIDCAHLHENPYDEESFLLWD